MAKTFMRPEGFRALNIGALINRIRVPLKGSLNGDLNGILQGLHDIGGLNN